MSIAGNRPVRTCVYTHRGETLRYAATSSMLISGSLGIRTSRDGLSVTRSASSALVRHPPRDLPSPVSRVSIAAFQSSHRTPPHPIDHVGESIVAAGVPDVSQCLPQPFVLG